MISGKQQLEQLLAERRYEKARIKCESLLKSNGQDSQLWIFMARIYLLSGKPSRALHCCQTAASYQPDLTEAVYIAGMAYKAEGNLAAAIQAFSHIVRLDHENLSARVQLAAAFAENGQGRQAIENYHVALELDPGNTAVLCNLGHALHAVGEYAEAISHYRKAIQINPNFELVHINLAFSLQALGSFVEALASYQAAHNINPQSISAITGEADILYMTGQEKEAQALIAPLLNLHSNHIPLISLYAHMVRKHGQHETALQYIQRALRNPATNRQDRIQLQFSAGSLCDALHEYDNAFAHYKEANQLVITNYNADHHRHCVDETIRYFSPETLRRLPSSGDSTLKPIFIIGMPRSGTSLVEQILASHPRVFAAGELQTIHHLSHSLTERLGTGNDGYPACCDALTRKQIKEEARAYIKNIESLSPDACRITDKAPHNFLHIPLIRLMFPEARIIHCTRHPLDTCLSCYFRLFSGGNEYAYDLINLARHYKDYMRLMQHWQQSLGIPMLEIRYEDIVTDQETYSRAIMEYCGLEWSEQCMTFYKTRREVPSASFDQVNKPMYKDSIHRWRHYEENLAELLRYIGDIVTDYESSSPS